LLNAETKRKLVWGIVLVLAIVHYDFWYWNDTSLVFGFMPVGLFFQALISIAAGLTWALVTRFAWPTWIEEWAAQTDDDDPQQEVGERGDE